MSSLQQLVGQHYAFGHGRLSVLMQQLLTQSDVDRFLGAPDFLSAKRTLTDVKFISNIDLESSVEEILHSALEDAFTVSKAMLPQEKQQMFDILWIPSDVTLTSFLIKEKKELTSAVAVKPLVRHTVFSEEQLMNLIDGGPDDAVPSELADAVREAMTYDTPQQIDARLAKAQVAIQMNQAKSLKSPIILRYVQHTIDLTNVRTLLRLDDKSRFAEEFLPGGLIPLDVFMDEEKSFNRTMETSAYAFAMKDVLRAVENGEWIALEQAIATVRRTDLQDMWNETLGPGPVFAYIATIMEQVQILRAILIGKQGKLDPQEIKKLTPELLTASHFA